MDGNLLIFFLASGLVVTTSFKAKSSYQVNNYFSKLISTLKKYVKPYFPVKVVYISVSVYKIKERLQTILDNKI